MLCLCKGRAQGVAGNGSSCCATGYASLIQALFLKPRSLDVILEAAKILVLVSGS